MEETDNSAQNTAPVSLSVLPASGHALSLLLLLLPLQFHSNKGFARTCPIPVRAGNMHKFSEVFFIAVLFHKRALMYSSSMPKHSICMHQQSTDIFSEIFTMLVTKKYLYICTFTAYIYGLFIL